MLPRLDTRLDCSIPRSSDPLAVVIGAEGVYGQTIHILKKINR